MGKKILNALGQEIRKIVYDSKGEPIILTLQEQKIANHVESQIKNAGYDVDVTTLTTIMKSVIDQKFFEVAPADFMPIKVGEGAWSQQLTTFRSFTLGDGFETGVMNTGSNNSKMASANVQIDAVNVPVKNWGKQIGWSLFDMQFASKSGNWDLVTALEKSRKRNWDLGIQQLAFLGLTGDSTNVPGLFGQSDVTEDTSTISKFIYSTSSAEFYTLCTAIYEAYRYNCKYTAKPTHFVIPEKDFNGLAAPYDTAFPLKTKLIVMQELFATLTGNKDFKILPIAYANKANHGTKNFYTLLNYDEDSLRMDIPVPYTNTLANSTDNFNFQNVGYGQFTPVKAYRPREMLYFTHTV